ncbi:Uncharacterized protein TCM_015704 [Theobroma cacao]|uniref:Uncharacterized protein n=1 Tax=Theobroma cacao TaxID=3641 RepID=A0A061GAB4_THECC|nr:Uncharacterized protein TCM_015704 [Theobroma cacao]
MEKHKEGWKVGRVKRILILGFLTRGDLRSWILFNPKGQKTGKGCSTVSYIQIAMVAAIAFDKLPNRAGQMLKRLWRQAASRPPSQVELVLRILTREARLTHSLYSQDHLPQFSNVDNIIKKTSSTCYDC